MLGLHSWTEGGCYTMGPTWIFRSRGSIGDFWSQHCWLAKEQWDALGNYCHHTPTIPGHFEAWGLCVGLGCQVTVPSLVFFFYYFMTHFKTLGGALRGRKIVSHNSVSRNLSNITVRTSGMISIVEKKPPESYDIPKDNWFLLRNCSIKE